MSERQLRGAAGLMLIVTTAYAVAIMQVGFLPTLIIGALTGIFVTSMGYSPWMIFDGDDYL